MLTTTIRYINDGEPLNEETLNRYGFDIEENLSDLYSRIIALEAIQGEVDEIPNTLVLRNNNGTSSFSEPTANTHPIRQADVVNNLTSDETNRPLSARQGKILDERTTELGEFNDQFDTNSFGSVGQTFFIDQNNTPNAFSPDYTLINDPAVVETTAELQAQQEFITDFRRVFTEWKRFSHYQLNGDGGPQPVNPSEINSWVYDEDQNSLYTTVNSSSIIGFVSPDRHDEYTLQTLMSSDGRDDDFIGLCAAFVTNDGYESAIYVTRTVGAGNITNFNRIGGALFNITAQITTASGTQWITIAKINGGLKWGDGVVDDSRETQNGAYGGWNDWYGCVLRIDRDGDNFTCRTSNLLEDANDNRAFVPTATVTFSLDDDPRLSIFKGKQSYGFMCFSQRNSTWVSEIRPTPIKSVFNRETGDIWSWTGTQFTVDSSVSESDIFDIGRFYHNEVTQRVYYNSAETGLRPITLRPSVDPDPNTVVQRDSQGRSFITGNGLEGIGSSADPTRVKISSRDGNLLQLSADGLYYGLEAPEEVAFLYVSSTLGNDSNAGTRAAPLLTINEALSRIPVNASSVIRLRAGETHTVTRDNVGLVQQAVRTFEPYDDPYVDGNMVPELTPTVFYYSFVEVAEVNRPIIEFDWDVDMSTDSARVAKFILISGGTLEFKACRIRRKAQPTASSYTDSSIIGGPTQNNGAVICLGCEIEDLATVGGDVNEMFYLRGDTGSLSFTLSSTRPVAGTGFILGLNEAHTSLVASLGSPPTPTPVSGITRFNDTFKDNAASHVSGVLKVNSVPVNLLTNLTNL